jgi:hypothetical protein
VSWPGLVPVAPLRDATLAAIDKGELNWADLARGLGYIKGKDHHPDTTRAQRLLGVVKAWGGRHGNGSNPPKLRTEMTYDNAVAVVRALGCDPVDFDL